MQHPAAASSTAASNLLRATKKLSYGSSLTQPPTLCRPSQAAINCHDNGDGSADVDYVPTAVGEYAAHILCDNEDIPGKYMVVLQLDLVDSYLRYSTFLLGQ